jgi:plastocyanin
LAAAGAVPLLALAGFAAADTPTSTATATSSATASATATGTPAASAVTLQIGGGETGITVDLFEPSKVTVKTGTTVTWVNSFTEPHTVTFGNPQGDPTTPLNVTPGTPVQYDGTQSFSSGLFGPGYPPVPGAPPSGTQFSVTFTKAGNYDYFCAIHPDMKGEMDVVDSGTVDTQDDINARAASEYAAGLASLKADEAKAPTAATVTNNADGTKTYTVAVGGPDNPNGALVQYFPPSVSVSTGDTVKWVSNTHEPHTVTFNPQLFQGDPVSAGPTGGPTFDGTGLVNSALIGEGYAATDFSLKFTKAGEYHYICLLHAPSGQLGVVTVSQGTTPPPTKTATGEAPQPPNTGTGTSSSGGNSLWVGLGLLGALFVISGAGVVAVKRHN